jgi:multidrug efflux system membrane fusion protein
VRQHILIALVGALVAAYILFWVFTQFFVFCRDAYVKTDVVEVAPEVSGPILKLEVGDNNRVVANAVLFQIDPEPFQIALHTQQAALALAQADLEKVQRQVGLAESQLAAQEATLTDAQKTMDRIAELFRGGEASAMTMEQCSEGLSSGFSRRTGGPKCARRRFARDCRTGRSDISSTGSSSQSRL